MNVYLKHSVSAFGKSTWRWLALCLALLILFGLAPRSSIEAQSLSISINDVRDTSFVVGYGDVPDETGHVVFDIEGPHGFTHRFIIALVYQYRSKKITGLTPGATYTVKASAHTSLVRTKGGAIVEWSRWLASAKTFVTTLATPPTPAPMSITASVENDGIRVRFNNFPASVDYFQVEVGGSRHYVANNSGTKRFGFMIHNHSLYRDTAYTITVSAWDGNRPTSAYASPNGSRIGTSVSAAVANVPGAKAPPAPLPQVPYTVEDTRSHAIRISFSAVPNAEIYLMTRSGPGHGHSLIFSDICRASTSRRTSQPRRPGTLSQILGSSGIDGRHDVDSLVTAQPDGIYNYCNLAADTVFAFKIQALRRHPSVGGRVFNSFEVIANSYFTVRTLPLGSGAPIGRLVQPPPVEELQQQPPQTLPSLNMNFSDISFTSVTVTWDDVGAQEYLLVYTGGGGGQAVALSAGTTSYTMSNLSPGTAYDVSLSAYWSDNRSIVEEQSVRTPDQISSRSSLSQDPPQQDPPQQDPPQQDPPQQDPPQQDPPQQDPPQQDPPQQDPPQQDPPQQDPPQQDPPQQDPPQQDPPQQDPPQQDPPQQDPPQQAQQQQDQPSGPFASLIQDMLSYQAEPHGHDHVNRWTRALAALGHGSHSNPMTLAEAEQMAQIHNPNRWNPVVAALRQLNPPPANTPVPPPPANTPVPPPANTPVPPPPPPEDPPYEVPASLIQDLLSYQAEPHGHDHVNRWTRALAGLGHGSHSNPMTLAEAEQMAQIHNPNRWNPVVEAMKKLQG